MVDAQIIFLASVFGCPVRQRSHAEGLEYSLQDRTACCRSELAGGGSGRPADPRDKRGSGAQSDVQPTTTNIYRPLESSMQVAFVSKEPGAHGGTRSRLRCPFLPRGHPHGVMCRTSRLRNGRAVCRDGHSCGVPGGTSGRPRSSGGREVPSASLYVGRSSAVGRSGEHTYTGTYAANSVSNDGSRSRKVAFGHSMPCALDSTCASASVARHDISHSTGAWKDRTVASMIPAPL
ncbi:hypothetical protein B0H21DRAFT_36168 [Amylocystis lapponica]|nr:hypothetical protein B0H21DRAFT_36168 [Amylocystis lapponica]